jgi:hypothetical protein
MHKTTSQTQSVQGPVQNFWFYIRIEASNESPVLEPRGSWKKFAVRIPNPGIRVCMYVCMYVRMLCMYVCYVCMYVWACVCMHACMHVCVTCRPAFLLWERKYVCMHECKHTQIWKLLIVLEMRAYGNI